MLCELFHRNPADIHTADADCPLRHIPETRNQFRHGGFSASGRPHKRRITSLRECQINAVQHFVLFLPAVGKMHVFQLDIVMFYRSLALRFWKPRHGKVGVELFYRHLHLTGIFGKHFELCQRSDHRHREHHCKRRLCTGNAATVRQIQADRKRPEQCGREQGKCQLHRHPCGGKPLHHKRSEIRDCLRIFFIGHTRASERLDDLDSLYVFHDGAVHALVRLIVDLKAFSADDKREHHAHHGERQRHKRGERQPPVQYRKRCQTDHRKHQMSGSLWNHVSERRLHILDLVYHDRLDLSDRVCLHFPERGMQKPVCHAKSELL